MNLYKYISNAINSKLGLNAKLEIPKNRNFGDFSTNAAIVGAKTFNQKPYDLATQYVTLLQELDFVDKVSIAGPGFINITIKDSFLLQNVSDSNNITPISPLKIDLDYGGYNVGKALHIGHLRTTIVGDTFNRVAKFIGFSTKSYNHIGDWGRPMGLIIAWILEYGMPKTADELNKIYPASSIRAKEDEAWLEKARNITSGLQNGNQEYKKIYDDFMKISLQQMDTILKRLNVMPFDATMGERGVAEYVNTTQQILENNNLLEESDGAMIVQIRQDTDNAPMPPLMFRTSSDTQTYAAADLSAIYYRNKTDNPDVIGYFTDSRQSLHFEQVFRVSKLAKLTNAKLLHTGFGAITGKDGKPFKTRDGGVANLTDILDMATEAVKRRISESDKHLDDKTVNTISLSAVKFNDLLHDVKSDYIFDPDSITSFEGKTGPYILYTAVRLNSVLKRANIEKYEYPSDFQLSSDEHNLLLAIMDFERTILSTYENRATDMIANYAYNLCQLANNFYHNCPILHDDISENVKLGRIYITKITVDILATVINLMGLEVPEIM